MKTINNETAKKLIQETQGKIFTAVFTKKDGTVRRMNCRLGVHSKLNGKGRKYDPANYDLTTVFDMKVNDYRNINLNTLSVLQIDGKVYYVTAA